MSRVFKRFYNVVSNTTLAHLSSEYQKPVHDALTQAETKYTTFKNAYIKGSKAHMSSTDPSDPDPVISVRLLDENGKRVETIHIHQDGSFKTKS